MQNKQKFDGILFFLDENEQDLEIVRGKSRALHFNDWAPNGVCFPIDIRSRCCYISRPSQGRGCFFKDSHGLQVQAE
jgi:hypothetical protein